MTGTFESRNRGLMVPCNDSNDIIILTSAALIMNFFCLNHGWCLALLVFHSLLTKCSLSIVGTSLFGNFVYGIPTCSFGRGL